MDPSWPFQVGIALLAFCGVFLVKAPPPEYIVSLTALALMLMAYQAAHTFLRVGNTAYAAIILGVMIVAWGTTKWIAKTIEDRSYFYLICEANGGTADPCDVRLINVSRSPFTNVSFEIIDTKNALGAPMFTRHVGDLEIGTTKTDMRIPQQGRYQVKLYSRETSYEENLDLTFSPKGEITQKIELKRASDGKILFRLPQ